MTVQALQFAVDGLTLRQQVTADNLSNTDTPGFTAGQVDFESGLQRALTSPVPTGATAAVTPSTAPAQANGNNVDMGQELVTAEETTLRYQTMVDALNTKFRILRGSIGGSFQ